MNLYQACIVIRGIFFSKMFKNKQFSANFFPFVSKMAARYLKIPYWELRTFTELDLKNESVSQLGKGLFQVPLTT